MKYLLKPIYPTTTLVNVLLIMGIALVGFVAMDIYFPSLPAISYTYQITPGQAQLTLTTFLTGFGFSQLFYGPLSDAYGRRPLIMLGFSIFFLGSLILIFAQSYHGLLLARIIQGVGAGAGASLGRVLLRDQYSGNALSKIASYLTIGVGLATALSPALGGVIQERVGYVGNFCVMLGFGTLVTLLVIFILPETNQKCDKTHIAIKTTIANYLYVFSTGTFVTNMLCSGLALAALLSYAIIAPFILQEQFHLTAKQYGYVALIIASGELSGTIINSLCVNQFGYRQMNFFGIILMLIPAIMLLILNTNNDISLLSIIMASFILTISIGIILPNTTAGAFSAIHYAYGTAGSIYGCFQIIITMLVTFWISNIAYQTATLLGSIILLLALASFLLFSLSVSRALVFYKKVLKIE